jgi:hypothetical protein
MGTIGNNNAKASYWKNANITQRRKMIQNEIRVKGRLKQWN